MQLSCPSSASITSATHTANLLLAQDVHSREVVETLEGTSAATIANTLQEQRAGSALERVKRGV